MITDHETQPTQCPQCGKEVTGALNPDGSGPPKAGDVAICIGCAAINRYANDEGNLRLATPAEMEELRADAEVWAAIEKYQAAVVQSHEAG